MNTYTYTEAADWHSNEDALASISHPSDGQILICALADGQGGQSGGALAAQTAISACIESAKTYSSHELANPFTWISIGESSDKRVSTVIGAGFTTLIGVAVFPAFLAGASCGDSAVALLLGNEFVLLTDKQHKNPPIGSGGAGLTPFSARLVPPWKLLVVSDGVWKYIGWERLERLIRTEDGSQLIQALRNAAVESKAGRLADDFSVILVQS